MSTIQTAYCNAADVRQIYPDIADFDKKRTFNGWAVSSGSLYVLGSTGAVNQLYRGGLELGAAEANVGAVDADGEWFYDSATDQLYLYSTDEPNANHIVEGGTDFTTLMTEAINRGSEMVESMVAKPIIQRVGVEYQGLTLRTYDEVIILSAAAMAAWLLIRPHRPKLADELVLPYNNEEGGAGFIQKVREGVYKLHNEHTPALGMGIPYPVSLDSTTTGSISDIQGRATQTDLIKVQIITGGTLTKGTTSTLTYSTWVSDGTGIQTSQVVTALLIDGGYQNIGHGLFAKFQPGIYVADDLWYVQCSAEPLDSQKAINAIQSTRLR